jgi:hypothetical protein
MPQLMISFRRLYHIGVLIVLFSALAGRAFAQEEPALPAPLCALIVQQVICYDMQNAKPIPLTPSDQTVSDFALSSPGDAVTYRIGGAVTLINIAHGTTTLLDSDAPAPDDLDLMLESMAWNYRTIAYITGNGLRLAILNGDYTVVQRASEPTRRYVNLRFSPYGTRLAAQTEDGRWRLFDATAGLKLLAEVNAAGELTWLDETRVIVAPDVGGLLRFDLGPDGLTRVWNKADSRYIKLIANDGGDVFAMVQDIGDTIGSVVEIADDGTITPISQAKIDARAMWGPNAEMMLYITSGTPILIDRVTGAEDFLPIRRAIKLAWAPYPPGPLPICRTFHPCRTPR